MRRRSMVQLVCVVVALLLNGCILVESPFIPDSAAAHPPVTGSYRTEKGDVLKVERIGSDYNVMFQGKGTDDTMVLRFARVIGRTEMFVIEARDAKGSVLAGWAIVSDAKIRIVSPGDSSQLLSACQQPGLVCDENDGFIESVEVRGKPEAILTLLATFPDDHALEGVLNLERID